MGSKVSLTASQVRSATRASTIPEWVDVAGRRMRLGQTGLQYQEIINDIAASLKSCDRPCSLALHLINASFGEYETSLHVELLKDDELKALFTRQALVEDFSFLTRTGRQFLKELSADQDLEYNIALFEQVIAIARRPSRGIKFPDLFTTHQLPTALIDRTITEMNLWAQAEKDRPTSQQTGYAAIQMLAHRPSCSYGAHEKLMQVVLLHYPVQGDDVLRLTDQWLNRASLRLDVAVTPKDRFLLMELYWLISQEHIFDLSGIHSLLTQYSSDLVDFGEITPVRLAKMTHSHAGVLLAKEILGTQDQIDRYLMALDNQELLAESLGADLGL